MKHSTKKLLSLVLTLVMGMMILCNTIVVRADEVNINGQKASEGAANASSFTGEGYEIKYYVDNYNTGEYQEQIWITNTGDKTIDNWKLKFNLPYNIDAICNGTWETYENEYQRCSDGTYLIPNQGWDANIEAGGCVQLSFKFKSDNGVVDPTKFQLLHIRVVLSWGDTPRDLDSHMLCSLPNTLAGHVDYRNKSFYNKNNLVCMLDLDDTIGYGPETTTIYHSEVGMYTFYVYNYSGEEKMDRSEATVSVYMNGAATPVYTFNIPTGDGRFWTVFRYNGATKIIIPINLVENNTINEGR